MTMNLDQIYQRIDEEREKKGFLKIQDLLALSFRGNIFLDPFSILISSSVADMIGTGNIFYPNVTVELLNGGLMQIGNQNVFHSQTLIVADQGAVIIGDHNQFGDGMVSLKANQPQSEIIVRNHGRYLNSVQVLGRSYLGTGSQVIGGLLTIQDCRLEDGESYQCQDCDLRAGVIKGFGLARNIQIARGKVLNGQGSFQMEDLKDQSFFHPKVKP